MFKFFLSATIVICAALVSGCVSANSMRLGNQTYPPRPDNYIIDVYAPIETPVAVQKSISGMKPMSSIPPYAKTIGRIDVKGAPAASWGSTIDKAQERARAMGGSGVVIKQWGTPVTGENSYGATYHGKALSVTVIRY